MMNIPRPWVPLVEYRLSGFEFLLVNDGSNPPQVAGSKIRKGGDFAQNGSCAPVESAFAGEEVSQTALPFDEFDTWAFLQLHEI